MDRVYPDRTDALNAEHNASTLAAERLRAEAREKLDKYDRLSERARKIMKLKEEPVSILINGERHSRPFPSEPVGTKTRYTGLIPIGTHPDTSQEVFGRVRVNELHKKEPNDHSYYDTLVLGMIRVEFFAREQGNFEKIELPASECGAAGEIVLDKNAGVEKTVEEKASAISGDLDEVGAKLSLMEVALGLAPELDNAS